jgi:hypothetical protein
MGIEDYYKRKFTALYNNHRLHWAKNSNERFYSCGTRICILAQGDRHCAPSIRRHWSDAKRRFTAIYGDPTCQ